MRCSKDMMLFNSCFLLCSVLGSNLNPILEPYNLFKFCYFWDYSWLSFLFRFDILWVLLRSCLWFLEGVLGGSWSQNLNKTYGFSRFLKMVFFGILKVFDGPFGVLLDFVGLIWSQDGFQNGCQKGSKKSLKIGQKKYPEKEQVCTSSGVQYGPT